MAREDQIRWDRKHAAEHGLEEPSEFLKEIMSGASWELSPGRALDIATGKGRNALMLAEHGFDVEGIDISAAGLVEAERRAREKSFSISWRRADLERIELPRSCYDLILNINYLQRSLVPQIKSALNARGFVIFETYLIGQEALGHPTNPAYLLGHNELLELFRGFRVLFYREGRFVEGGRTALRAGLFAQKLH
jgi:SAM-dependent methyltransferase